MEQIQKALKDLETLGYDQPSFTIFNDYSGSFNVDNDSILLSNVELYFEGPRELKVICSFIDLNVTMFNYQHKVQSNDISNNTK